MKRIIIPALLGAFLSLYFMQRSRNNVCKTFQDYYTDRDNNENCYYNPDYSLRVPDIIKRRGYPVEVHKATTEDGYIITVFRIPRGKQINQGKRRPPVFIQHGFGLSSEAFVNTGNKSLAFVLADAGYDVWLGNFRGTSYSRDHLYLNDTDQQFWNFSFHEIGLYDMPAQLDVVSNITQQKIIYIGYSMGVSTSYLYGINYPEIAQEKVKIFIGLAPPAFFKEWKSATGYLLSLWYYSEPAISWLTNGIFYVREFPPRIVRKLLCFPFPFQMNICQLGDMLAWGFNYEQNDPETLPITLLQNAESASVKTISHVTQLISSGNFQKYDYGPKKNERLYGSPNPPQYDFSKLKVPVYLVRGNNDLMCTKKNVEVLNATLPEEVKPYDIYVVKDDKFNHGDFLLAKDVVPLLYDHLLNFMKNL